MREQKWTRIGRPETPVYPGQMPRSEINLTIRMTLNAKLDLAGSEMQVMAPFENDDHVVEGGTQAPSDDKPDRREYPNDIRLGFIVLSLCLSLFLGGLDQRSSRLPLPSSRTSSEH